MRKYGRIFSLIMLVALMMINSLTVLGAEGENLGSWETISPMPTAIYDGGLAEVNRKIYTIGGATTGGMKSTVEEYDPSTKTWHSKTSIPTPRQSFGVVEANGKIYAIGGHDGYNLYAKVEEYDPLTDMWTSKTSMPTARRHFGIAESKGKIYVIGGTNSQGISISTVEEYDPLTDAWTTKASMQEARNLLQAVEGNGKVYAIGGANSEVLKTVEEYDPQTNTWTSKSSLLSPRSYFGATEVNGKIYVIGGRGLSSDALSTVEEYDPLKDIWTTKANMPTARVGLDIVASNNKIYALGGSNGGYLDTVEVFTPPTSENVISPTNLIATSSSNNITLSWDTVSDADSYTLLRSTTSGTIDTVIATNITGTTYTDTNVTPGVTYYYVVRAVKNSVESADSNIASAMVEISNNRALLLIKLLDENDKEYDLAMSDIGTFMNWYFDRGTGQGPAYYAFTKDYNAGPYISRKDYISYDKIICIEVNEYTK